MDRALRRLLPGYGVEAKLITLATLVGVAVLTKVGAHNLQMDGRALLLVVVADCIWLITLVARVGCPA